MAPANKRRVINANILLYGPAMSGKSSNLRYIQKKLKPEQRGEIETRTQDTDPSVVYEYLPIKLGELMGYETNLFIYTVPDGETALETRLNLLPGAAGVAFIAHSSASRMADNLASLDALKDELRYFDLDFDTFPLLFQYNHRDASDALPIEVLERRLNPEGKPIFEAIASSGEGVRSTFAAISKMAVRRVRLQLISEEGGNPDELDAEPAPPPRTRTSEPAPRPTPAPEATPRPAPAPEPAPRTPEPTASVVVATPAPVAPAPPPPAPAPVEAPVAAAAPVAPISAPARSQPESVTDLEEEASNLAAEAHGRGKKKSKQSKGRSPSTPAPRGLDGTDDSSAFDAEASGDYPRPAGEDFLTTRLSSQLSDDAEPLEVMEALGAEDDEDDREVTGGRPATGRGGSLFNDPLGEGEERGALTLHDIPSMPDIAMATPSVPDEMRIVTYVEDEEDEDIHLLGQAGALRDSELGFQEEEFDLDDELEDLGLEEGGGDEPPAEEPLADEPEAPSQPEEPAEQEDFDSDDEDRSIIATPEQISNANEILSAPVVPDSFALPEEGPGPVAEPDLATVEEWPTVSDLSTPVDDDALRAELGGEPAPLGEDAPQAGVGEFEDEVTADVAPLSAEAELAPGDEAAAEAPAAHEAAPAAFSRWGEVVRVDARTLQLPVTVQLPDGGGEVQLVVTLHVDQLTAGLLPPSQS